MSFKPYDTLDKLSAPTYYFPIMAGERLQRQIDRLLDESLAISSELGMRPLMERVLFRREILKA